MQAMRRLRQVSADVLQQSVASAVGGSPCLAVLAGGGRGVCWPALPFRGSVAAVLKDWH